MKKLLANFCFVCAIFILSACQENKSIVYPTQDSIAEVTATRIEQNIEIVSSPNLNKETEEGDTISQLITTNEEYLIETLQLKRDELNIYGKMYLPQDGKDKHPIVILGHGFGADHTYNIKYAEMFAKAGIACYIFDFCGGGMGSRSDGSMLDMSILTEAVDMNAVLDQIKMLDYVDADNIFLMGESQGGCVAALTAPDRMSEIQGLILYYPALGIPEGINKRYSSAYQIPDTSSVFGIQIGKKYYEDVLSLDVYSVIADYTDDVLIIHGNRDSIVPISYSERAVDTYESAELITLDGAGHTFSGSDAEQAGQETIRFITEHIN